ncbi:carboxypeptidase regulatory-like domain-containing protein [Geobacter sp. AOG1]|uniref:carboxypeptidase regulatory-like domain-containing protein n=1 Tax=Geobacter sp. AOG1 TaxID=1566346 RepID=UPI001CC39695|nr:carboxypeptidase regulatory-like domain-containing protein [Geobacter sp. AOG1]GFE59357.1 hypothetical protein AOG1_32370 [Geobacter sp. AOG1]
MKRWRGLWGRMIPAVAFLVLFVGVVSANAYTVSGTVTNSSGKTGSRVYIGLNGQYGGNATYGVSIPAPAPGTSAGYTIRGVPAGSYVANAFLDLRGNTSATHHANDPVGSNNTIVITGADAVNADITLNLPSAGYPAPLAPALNGVIPGPGAALVNWNTPFSNNGNEIAYSYNVYWHTADTVSPTVYTGKKTGIPARDNGMYIQTMLDATTPLADGTTLWYVVTAQFGPNGQPGSIESPVSNTFGPVTIGAIPSDYTSSFDASGVVTIDSAISPITGPLLMAIYTEGPGTRIFKIDNPGTSNPFTVTGLPNGNYQVFSLVDQNKDGVIWTGDYTVGDRLAPAITVNGANVSGITSTIPKRDVEASVATSHYIDASGQEGFGLNFSARPDFKQPVNVTVLTGQDVAGPVDLAVRQSGDFSYQVSGIPRPAVGTEYTLDIGYSDGTTGSETVAVTAVLDSFADPVSPKGKVTFNPTPTFSWTAPSSPPAGYTYSMNLNGNDLWWGVDRILSSQTSVLFNFDNNANSNSLSDNVVYTWEIAVNDVNGNEARKQASFFSGGSISGTVKGSDTNSGVAGINVQLYDNNGNSMPGNYNTMTAADGGFVIGGLQTGTYRVCFWTNQTGYVAQCYDNMASYSAQATNISVTYPNNTALNPITLIKSAAITGTVTASGGGAIQGISVELRDTNGNWISGPNQTQTDAVGNYTLNGLQAGSYKLYFNGAAQGYIGQWYNGKSDSTSADTITLSTGQTQTANAILTLGGIITGQVTNGATGIQNVSVELRDTNGNWIPGINSAMTNASGNYTMGGIPAGNYKLYFNGSNAGYSSQWYNGKSDSGSANTLNVTAGGTYPLTTAVLTALPPISVAGSVIDNASTPLNGVTIEQLGSANTATSTTDGTFAINNIPGGMWFELKMTQGTTYVPTYSGWLSSSSNLTLSYPYRLLTPAEVSTVLGITSGKGAILGRLVNSVNPAVAVSGGTVTAYGPSPSYVVRYFDSATQQFTGTTATDASGIFLIRDVEDGANIGINATIGASNIGNLNVTTHAPGVSEVAMLCNIPQPSGNLQWPASITVTTTQTTENILGLVYLWGVTDTAPGPATGLVAELGYGPTGTAPSSPSWVWKTATYNTQVGGNYEYLSNLSVTTVGNYDYAFRYSYYGSYVYSDLSGSENGNSPLPNAGKLTVLLAPGPLDHFQVAGIASPVTAGTANSVTVTAKDAGNTTITGYTGTVHFTSTDAQAVLPGDYTFTAGDNGTHTFTNGVTLKTAGSQTVTATDTVTSSITGTTGPISVNPAAGNTAAKIGIFSDGYWYLDTNRSWAWDGTPTDTLSIFGLNIPGAIPVVGDWNGDGKTEIGVFINGIWYLDMNGNGQWDGEGIDVRGVFGAGVPNAIPVVGDWNGDGKTKIGIYADGIWYLDVNQNWAWDGEGIDVRGVFGIGLPNAKPVVGDWNGDGITEIGVYSEGHWYLDKNRNWTWDGEPTDTHGVFGNGLPNVVPVTGDWNGDGITKIGVYSDGNWYLDKNNNWAWDGEPTDTYGVFGIGVPNAVPVVGNW